MKDPLSQSQALKTAEKLRQAICVLFLSMWSPVCFSLSVSVTVDSAVQTLGTDKDTIDRRSNVCFSE